MNLSGDFQFSQSSLQDYTDCARRFQLRYNQRLAWPAVDVVPIREKEKFLQQGATFHRMVHRHQIGLPSPSFGDDEELKEWWDNYIQYPPPDLPEKRYPEITLSARLGEHRIMAKYDLVAVGERIVIVDWKTSPRRPPRGWLAARLQTRIYRYLLVRSGADLNHGEAVRPDRVAMIYWFANFPTEPETFVYDQAQVEMDESFLAQLMDRIVGGEGDDFPLVDDERVCRFCRYRSLCGRGNEIGALSELAEWLDQMNDDTPIQPMGDLEF